VQQFGSGLVLLMFEQSPHERLARILLGLVLLSRVRARQQRARLDMNQRRRHDEELARNIQVQLLHQGDVGEVLLGDERNRDVVDVHLVLANEVNQQVKRSLERIELDLVRIWRGFEVGVLGRLLFRHFNHEGHEEERSSRH
jgi:hypothetical protein